MRRWSGKGRREAIFTALSQDPDLEYLRVDGSIARVHPQGAPQKSQDQEAVGISRSGLSTKIHAAVDTLGNPVRFLLTSGQASECGPASAMIEGFAMAYVLADKGDDSDQFMAVIQPRTPSRMIPPRRNRKEQRPYDETLHKERNLVERLFQKLKQFRRPATRYERLVRNYIAMLYLASTMIWPN